MHRFYTASAVVSIISAVFKKDAVSNAIFRAFENSFHPKLL